MAMPELPVSLEAVSCAVPQAGRRAAAPLHLLPYETPSVHPIFTAKVTLERHVLAGVAALRQLPLPKGCVQHS